MRIAVTFFLIVGILLSAYFFIKPNRHDYSKQVKKNEKYYQTKLCEQLEGKMEYRLPDATRVDCLTKKYAIEVDFGRKWAEAIGQSLYYSILTNRQPAIGLIIDIKKEKRFLNRLQVVASPLNIKIIPIKKHE